MTDQACVFCEIIAGRAPASFVYEDDVMVGFLVLEPVTPGHLMVVPRRHLRALADLDEPTGAHMFVVANRLASALRSSGLRCDGVNLFYADGEVAFQEIFHAHLHVIPRFEGDGFTIDANWDNRPSRAELDHNATMIREGLAADAGGTSRLSP